jgi:hypothetical protein
MFMQHVNLSTIRCYGNPKLRKSRVSAEPYVYESFVYA